jgi:predicted  nucleic acid-binding Zn-ribbon protein
VATLKRRGQSLEAELEQCKKEVQARQHMLDSLRESLASREHTVESLRESVGEQAADFVRKSAAATAKIEELEQVGIRQHTSAYVGMRSHTLAYVKLKSLIRRGGSWRAKYTSSMRSSGGTTWT